jgi:hypothetical protein
MEIHCEEEGRYVCIFYRKEIVVLEIFETVLLDYTKLNWVTGRPN